MTTTACSSHSDDLGCTSSSSGRFVGETVDPFDEVSSGTRNSTDAALSEDVIARAVESIVVAGVACRLGVLETDVITTSCMSDVIKVAGATPGRRLLLPDDILENRLAFIRAERDLGCRELFLCVDAGTGKAQAARPFSPKT